MNGNDEPNQGSAGASPYRGNGGGRGATRAAEDRLPPHSPEAEVGGLGCVLLSPAVLEEFLARFGADRVFFDLRHQTVWDAMVTMRDGGLAIDLITLQQRLKDVKQLDQVGGLGWLGTLPDTVPSAANWQYYADIVWEKFLLRRTVQFNMAAVGRLYEWEGEVGMVMDQLTRDWETIARLQERGGVTPKYLTRVSECAEEVMAKWMSGADGSEPGLELAVPFPMKVRRKESTLITGDNGGGKSTALSYILLHLASHPGEKLCIASMEMPKVVTLWMLGAQLVGMKHLPDSQAGMSKGAAALSWLNERVVIYDFLGITRWQEMLDTFRYAAEHLGCTQFMVDSVMKVGIADDDYAQQGYCASAFLDFAMKHDAHLWYVVHENKGGDRGKGRDPGVEAVERQRVQHHPDRAEPEEGGEGGEFKRAVVGGTGARVVGPGPGGDCEAGEEGDRGQQAAMGHAGGAAEAAVSGDAAERGRGVFL